MLSGCSANLRLPVPDVVYFCEAYFRTYHVIKYLFCILHRNTSWNYNLTLWHITHLHEFTLFPLYLIMPFNDFYSFKMIGGWFLFSIWRYLINFEAISSCPWLYLSTNLVCFQVPSWIQRSLCEAAVSAFSAITEDKQTKIPILLVLHMCGIWMWMVCIAFCLPYFDSTKQNVRCLKLKFNCILTAKSDICSKYEWIFCSWKRALRSPPQHNQWIMEPWKHDLNFQFSP